METFSGCELQITGCELQIEFCSMHIGKKIMKLRELRGIKQEDLAQHLNISQQAVSKLEGKEDIDAHTLEKIAERLGFTVDAIKEFNPDAIIQHVQQQSGNLGNVIGYNINPLDKIVELYEQLLKAKEREIESLKQQLQDKHS
ncbi:MAG: helix-turn-helix domain-containing protein [Chitinophagales bacterium]|nr:helix-turn-helix domain-containing protein [Chitinophagales bacterium]